MLLMNRLEEMEKDERHAYTICTTDLDACVERIMKRCVQDLCLVMDELLSLMNHYRYDDSFFFECDVKSQYSELETMQDNIQSYLEQLVYMYYSCIGFIIEQKIYISVSYGLENESVEFKNTLENKLYIQKISYGGEEYSKAKTLLLRTELEAYVKGLCNGFRSCTYPIDECIKRGFRCVQENSHKDSDKIQAIYFFKGLEYEIYLKKLEDEIEKVRNLEIHEINHIFSSSF